MPRALCTACHDHKAALPAQLCRACVRDVHRALAALPEWSEALLERPRGIVGPRVSGGGDTTPSPAADAALDHRAEIRGALVAWTVHLSATHGIRTPVEALGMRLGEAQDAIRTAKFAAVDADTPSLAVTALRRMLSASRVAAAAMARLDRATGIDQVRALAEHLYLHADTILATDQAPVLASDLEQLLDRARAIAAPGRPDTVPIGRCPTCSSKVVAEPTAHRAWCLRCDEARPLSWWEEHLTAAAEWLPSGRLRMHLLLAHDIRVTEAQLWQWVHRGYVETRGTGKGTTYRVEDAVAKAQGRTPRGVAVHTVRHPA